MTIPADSPSTLSIRPCTEQDLREIHTIINDAASAYRGVIPADRWHEPYMPWDELCAEVAAGVRFFACVQATTLLGVMGLQAKGEVTLIRHAYVRTAFRNQGIGGILLRHLLKETDRPVLIGTWAAATWAVRFYQRQGFALVPEPVKNQLLKTYWTVPDRQIATSVVLVDERGWKKFAT